MDESNYFLIVSQGNRNVVQPQNASIEPNAPIVVATRNPEGDASYDSQLWFEKEGYIVNKYSGLMLCVDESDELAYQRKKIRMCDRWGFDSTIGLIYCLTNSSMVLAARGGGDDDIKRVVSSGRSLSVETLDQMWFLEPVKTRILPTKIENTDVQSVKSPKDARAHEGAAVASITPTRSTYLKYNGTTIFRDSTPDRKFTLAGIRQSDLSCLFFLDQILWIFFANSWKLLFTRSSTSVGSIHLTSSKDAKNIMFLSKCLVTRDSMPTYMTSSWHASQISIRVSSTRFAS